MTHSTVRLGNGSSVFTETPNCVDRWKTDSRQALYTGIPLLPGLSGVTLVCLYAMPAIAPWYCGPRQTYFTASTSLI